MEGAIPHRPRLPGVGPPMVSEEAAGPLRQRCSRFDHGHRTCRHPHVMALVWDIFFSAAVNQFVIFVQHILGVNKMAGRHGAPRPPMTDVGTETAFRLEKAQAFPKK